MQEDAPQVPRVAQPSKRIKAIVGFGATVVLLLAIKLLPRIWSEYELRQAAADQVRDVVVQQVANGAVREAAREAAAEAARDIAAGVRNDSTGQSSAFVLDRVGYTITFPEGASVDPESREVDQDHLTAANLPNHGTLVLIMIDDKTLGPAAFDRTVASVQAKLQTFTTESATTFDAGKAVRSVALRGTPDGKESFVFEVAQLDGPTRAYLVIAEYPESSTADASTLLKRALGTLHLKV